MNRLLSNLTAPIWSKNLIMLAVITFLNRFGQGVLGGASMNFFVETLGLTDGQVLAMEGIREIPGLSLMFIAALIRFLPLSQQSVLAVVLMGVGYILYAPVSSYGGLVFASLLASLGMHMWMPIYPSLSMGMATKETAGRVLGALGSVGALAAIAGMGVIALSSRVLADMSLRVYYLIGGSIIVCSGLLTLKLPRNIGATARPQPKMLVSKRYWLYYVLTFFEGSRKEVLGTFVTLFLVKVFNFQVWQTSLLLLSSSAINLLASPYMGYMIDRHGERKTLAASYILLALGCIGYATIRSIWLLIPVALMMKMLVLMSMGLNTYVNKMAPAEELMPTLSTGVSINHITSVAMPLVAGAVLPFVGYSGIFLGTGCLIACSIPFAVAMRHARPAILQPSPAAAD